MTPKQEDFKRSHWDSFFYLFIFYAYERGKIFLKDDC